MDLSYKSMVGGENILKTIFADNFGMGLTTGSMTFYTVYTSPGIPFTIESTNQLSTNQLTTLE